MAARPPHTSSATPHTSERRHYLRKTEIYRQEGVEGDAILSTVWEAAAAEGRAGTFMPASTCPRPARQQQVVPPHAASCRHPGRRRATSPAPHAMPLCHSLYTGTFPSCRHSSSHASPGSGLQLSLTSRAALRSPFRHFPRPAQCTQRLQSLSHCINVAGVTRAAVRVFS